MYLHISLLWNIRALLPLPLLTFVFHGHMVYFLHMFSTQCIAIIFIFFLRFYLFMRENREGEKQRHRQREKQAPCRMPDVGLDPWTPGSGPWAEGRECEKGGLVAVRIQKGPQVWNLFCECSME